MKTSSRRLSPCRWYAGKSFYLDLDFLGGVFRDPLALDAVVEERADETLFLGRRDSTKTT
jgi:hypothetical protein